MAIFLKMKTQNFDTRKTNESCLKDQATNDLIKKRRVTNVANSWSKETKKYHLWYQISSLFICQGLLSFKWLKGNVWKSYLKYLPGLCKGVKWDQCLWGYLYDRIYFNILEISNFKEIHMTGASTNPKKLTLKKT